MSRISSDAWFVLGGIILHLPVLLLVAANPARTLPPGDPPGYLLLAENFLANGVFSIFTTPPFIPEVFRTPGYPLFLASLLAIGNHSIGMVVAAQSFLRIISSLLLASIAGTLLRSKGLGRIAGVVGMLAPIPVLYAGVIAPETLFVFLFLTALFFLLRGTIRTHALAGFLLGLVVLVRPIGILLLIILIPVVGMMGGKQRVLLRMAAYLCAAGIALAPWLVRNELAFGRPALASVSGVNLLEYNAASCLGRRTGGNWESGRAQAQQRYRTYVEANQLHPASAVEESDAMTAVAIGIYFESPLECIAVSVADGANTLRPGASYAMLFLRPDFLNQSDSAVLYSPAFQNLKDPIVLVVTVLLSLWYAGLYGTALMGVCWMLIQRRWDILFVCVLPILLLVIAPGMAGNARFRIPLDPGLSLLAVAGVAWGWGVWRRRFSRKGN